MLLAQCLFISAQQVEINTARGIAYVSASKAGAAPAVDGVARAPQRALASTERGVGYCEGDSITTRGARVGTAGSYDMAALLSKQFMQNYKGCKIIGVRFALSQSVGKSNIFIYKVDDDGNAEEVVRNNVRRTSEGWNEVRLNSAQEIDITGNDQYIMGFTYNETDEMVTDKTGALCFYGDKISNSGSALILQGETFNSITNFGDLCVQLIVDVSTLPRKAVSLNSILNGVSYKKLGEKMDIMMSYTNAGLDEISSMRLGFRVDDGEAEYIDVNFKEPMAPGKSDTYSVSYGMPAAVAIGRHELNVFVDKIDGETPVASAFGTIVDPFVAYGNALKRQQIYVEQYNSQKSPYGPLINDSFAKLAKDKDVCAVNLYRLGEPLAVAESSYLYDLYSYTDAPCSTANRFYFGMAEPHYAFDINEYAALMPQLVYDGFRVFVDEALPFPAFATVDLATSYDAAARQISINVNGDISDEAPAVMGDMALTVLLTEDNVKSTQIVSSGSSLQNKQNYVHNQVMRKYISAPLGDRITVDGNKYAAHYTFTLPSDWKDSDITVVAFLTKAFDFVDGSNMQMADVTNCNSVKLGGATAIDGIVSDAAVGSSADGIYTLDGVRLADDSAAKGIFIVRRGGKSVKVVR